MSLWKTAVLTLSIVLAAGCAIAQPGQGMRCMQRFSALDTNKDGKVTLEEFLSVQHPRGADAAKATFAARDTNQDGVVTAMEFCSGR